MKKWKLLIFLHNFLQKIWNFIGFLYILAVLTFLLFSIYVNQYVDLQYMWYEYNEKNI